MTSPATTLPVSATARLQFHKDFTLDHAVELVDYYASLGASHIYASPLLKSRPGSMHGYDIVDHHEIDPELGGMPALERLVAALRAKGMGLILDIVPNHMGIGGADNAWWLDVLEWGPASDHADTFDIDWSPADPAMRNKMLAPFLGEPYGDALAAGALKLAFLPEEGRIVCEAYGEHRFPINPRDYPLILRHGGLEGATLEPFEPRAGGRREDKRRARAGREALRDPLLRPAVDRALAAFDPGDDEGRARLHALLERQHYRLSWWRAATDEINWRRFFDVSSLAGVRAELPRVFDATHDFILKLYADGLIDGLRVDHVDGLAEPRAYCRKLRRKLRTAAARRPAGLNKEPAVLWVEKILAPHERLDAGWLTDGTTGYDYMNDVAAVLHDPAGEEGFSRLWREHSGQTVSFADMLEAARRQILRENLSSEWFSVATALHRMARRDPATRDYTLTAIRWTLLELLSHFHAYRIYAGIGGLSASDKKIFDWAMARARRSVRSADRSLLELIGRWMSGEGLRELPPGRRRREWLRAMVKFQQLSSPLAAKSLEDTVFYRYGRLLSRNEVGSEPSQFALSPHGFHGLMRDRRKHCPRALLSTATHDHKRGEDARARLAALSERPEEWGVALTRWTRLNAGLKRDIDGPAPDAADEIMLYQSLIGAWPLGARPDDQAAMERLRERVGAWQVKALREAKRHTSHTAPNEAYEAACADFLGCLFDPHRPARILEDIAGFVQRLDAPGVCNSLAQTLLRATCPGIPDTYQGTEFWDFSLVDPDNRTPVDFPARRRALAVDVDPATLMASWRDGRVKQSVLHRALEARRRTPRLFTEGEYVPLEAEGPAANHVLAFLRLHEGRAALVAVTRLPIGLGVTDAPLPSPEAWAGTVIKLQDQARGLRLRDVLGGGDPGETGDGGIPAAKLFARLPVALLEG